MSNPQEIAALLEVLKAANVKLFEANGLKVVFGDPAPTVIKREVAGVPVPSDLASLFPYGVEG